MPGETVLPLSLFYRSTEIRSVGRKTLRMDNILASMMFLFCSSAREGSLNHVPRP